MTQASTSLRWNVATTATLLAVTVAVIWWNIDRIARYESAAAAATVPVAAQVVRSTDMDEGDDVVTVAYRDQAGVVHDVDYPVGDAAAFPVGGDFGRRAIPVRRRSIRPATGSTRHRSTAPSGSG